ncbi:hypothetical protein J2Z50_006191 [Ensifer mexicanus]|nr:hypothetical protein [Sinorhizobium mexicanum]
MRAPRCARIMTSPPNGSAYGYFLNARQGNATFGVRSRRWGRSYLKHGER